MNKQREAMQFALETLEDIFGKHKIDVTAINMLREALAEPEQEPVAWMCADEDMTRKGYSRFSRNCEGEWNIPVYTTPPARKPLTDTEIDALFNSQAWVSVVFFDAYGKPLERASSRDFARAVERAHGIGD